MDVQQQIDNETIPLFPTGNFKLGIVKICLFTMFFVLGLIGNSLVLIGIGLNKGMQTPTNLLIFNLAVADILFIIVCIPSTLFSFIGRWPFANIGCILGELTERKSICLCVQQIFVYFDSSKMKQIQAQFINHLSAFMSIYLLVFMSIDRYFAVVHAIDSISSYRTIRNTTVSIALVPRRKLDETKKLFFFLLFIQNSLVYRNFDFYPDRLFVHCVGIRHSCFHVLFTEIFTTNERGQRNGFEHSSNSPVRSKSLLVGLRRISLCTPVDDHCDSLRSNVEIFTWSSRSIGRTK